MLQGYLGREPCSRERRQLPRTNALQQRQDLLVQDSGAVAGPFTRRLPRATCSHLRIYATAR